MQTINVLLLQLGIGLSFGLLLFLVASGLTLTFGLARYVNLAHGAVFLIAAYVATSFDSFPLAVLAATATGLVLSTTVYGVSRLRWKVVGSNPLNQVLITFGFILVLAEVAHFVWHGVPQALSAPEILSGSVAMGTAAFPVYRIFMGATSLAIGVGLWWLQERTTFGALVRAGVDDPEMLAGSGIRAAPLFAGVFAIAGLLAGAAAGLGAPVLGASVGYEITILVFALVVVVIGGPGNLLGAFIASIGIGVADSLGKMLMPTFANFTMMALVVIVLVWRPQGLFGGATR